MSQIWEYNGVQYEFDLMDAETADRYDKALEKMGEKEKSIRKTGKLSETIMDTCDMIYGFFDDLFGDGASDKIFARNYNLRLCIEVCFNSFRPFANKQLEELNAYNNRMMPTPVINAVPSPMPNREQRRRNKKKNK